MTTTKTVGLVIAGVIVSVLFSGMMIASMAGNSLGGVYNEVTNTFRGGINVGTSNQATISATGVVTTSGAVTATGGVTLGDGTATTSMVANLFCLQIYPTSTATAVKIRATSTGASQASPLYSAFGTCP